MPSFTFDSNKKFVLVFFGIGIALFAAFYFFVEKKAEQFDAQSKDGMFNYFLQYKRPSNFITLGTSHSNKYELKTRLSHINLAEAFTIPPVMYLKSKWIVSHHPETKIVYLEADEHLFFDSPVFDMSGLTPDEKREHGIFRWGGAFLDGSGTVFGEVSPASDNRWLLLSPDVKPVLLKRIAQQYWKSVAPAKPEKSAVFSDFACDMSAYPDELVIDEESTWSAREPVDKARRIQSRYSDAEFGLDTPKPLSDFMTSYYEKTIDLLRDAGIEVVLVFYPKVPEVDVAIAPENRDRHQQYIEQLRAEKQLRVLDLRHLASHGERFFEDQDHVAKPYWWFIGKQLNMDFCAHAVPD